LQSRGCQLIFTKKGTLIAALPSHMHSSYLQYSGNDGFCKASIRPMDGGGISMSSASLSLAESHCDHPDRPVMTGGDRGKLKSSQILPRWAEITKYNILTTRDTWFFV